MKKRGFLTLAVLSLFAVAVTGCKDNEVPPSPPIGDEDTLQKIEVSGGTRQFIVGDDFAVGDLVVKAIYSVSGTKTLTSSEYSVDSSKVDKAKPGSYEIVVSFQGVETKYSVTYDVKAPTIVHQDAFVKALPEGAVIRKFNSLFDTSINDFSGETLVGSTENGVYDSNSKLRVLVDNEAEGFPNSPDASIYKMATGTYDLATAGSIGFKMRVVSGTIDYSNFVLGLRGDDAYEVFEISLADALDEDGEALPKLSKEYQEIMISPNLSIEDADTEYVLASSKENSGVKVLSKILGFHLYAKEECSAVIEIEEVYFTVAGEKTILDKFDREAVNKADETCWWRDSTGFIVLPSITLNSNATYTTPTLANEDNTQLVVSLLGDTTGLTITPVVHATAKTAIPWANLKNVDGAAVAHAVNGAFYPYAIDLEKSGLLEEGLDGFIFTSSTECSISSVFYSSLKEKEAATEYPRLDTENAVIFDNFNRTQATVDTTYEASIVNEKVLDAGLHYMVNYNGNDKLSVDGDALVFAPQDVYTDLDFASSRKRTNQKYMVFAIKVDGGDLSGFRIKDTKLTEFHCNSWYAGEGLKSIPEDLTDYPYITEDGYVWYIIDLEVTGMSVEDHLILYYTGEGTMYIDSIFFADESVLGSWTDIRTNEETIDITAGYKYLWGGANTTGSKFMMELKGDGTVTFESFRIAHAGTTIWLKDGLKAYYADGTAVTATSVIPTDPTKIYIDFEENGITPEAGNIDLHWGDFGEAVGEITLFKTSVFVVATEYSLKLNEEPIEVTITDDAAYQYLLNNAYGFSKLKLVLKGDGEVSLASFRLQIQDQGDYIWAKDVLVLLKEDGTVYDYALAIPEEGVTIYIDLAQSGWEVFNNHIHSFFGGNGGNGALTIESIEGVSEKAPYPIILEAYDEVIPAPVETPEE